jgi:hypothetical protein
MNKSTVLLVEDELIIARDSQALRPTPRSPTRLSG